MRRTMRVLACNPDTIGDVLLRQPLYRAIQEAGHELCLIVRPLLEPIITSIAPGARVIVCDINLYEAGLEVDSPTLAGVVARAKEFAPDMLVVAAYQWTVLEERLSLDLPNVPTVAMTGKRYANPNFGSAPRSQLRVTRSVSVAEDLPEIAKNQLLAGAVLGVANVLPDPAMEPSADHLRAADSVLNKLGLAAGEYWVACVGDSQFTRVRNWDPERWSELLAAWTARHNRRFLLIGHRTEEESMRVVAQAAADRSGPAPIWVGGEDGDLNVLAGLIGRSSGYVGRDTGPMHMAAAMGKPLLALFGGGTWPRFLPAAKVSVSLALSVPCFGCGWLCHLPRSYCIKDIPVADVLKAASDLEEGRVTTRETRVFNADQSLLAKIGRGGAEAARERMYEVSVLRREQKVDPESLTAALERALKQAARADAVAAELESLRSESARRESVLRQRLAAFENTAAAREANLKERLAATEAKLSQQTVSAEKLAEVRAAHAQRESELHTQLKKALRELTERQFVESDLSLRVQKLESDRETLGALTHQQETEVVVLRQRINDLMASRWRKYGQKLGLCMTLPWESENGGS